MIENSDVMYRLLVQSVVDYAIYMLKPDGTIVNWNPGAEQAKGYSSDEIIGKNFSRFYSEEDRQRGVPQQGLDIARMTGRYETEGWRYRKNGTAFWAHVIIDAIRDERGELIGFAKVTRDCTRLRAHQNEMREARELAERHGEKMAALSTFLDTIVANIPSSVIVEDIVTREILLINDRAQTLLGGSQADFLGKKLAQCMTSEMSEYFMQLSDGAQRKEGMCRSERMLVSQGRERIISATANIIRGSDATHDYVLLIAEDVTDRRMADARIHHMAHHDNLTGLPNRVLFSQRLKEALHADGCKGRLTAAMCLDLDNFKNVNDALGHQMGDDLLRAVAVRLRSVLRENDTLARNGGDEFSVVLPGLQHAEEAEVIACRLIDTLSAPFNIDGHTFSVGLSVGIAIAGSGNDTPGQLLRCADMALYEAKRNGRNRFEHFTPQMGELAAKRRLIENDLREAISGRQLRLYYQPITDNTHQQIVGYEALMRWHHPENGIIMPMDFIPIAEETGLIHSIGAYALHEACREAASWPGEQSVAVNLSPMQFKNSALVSVVEAALKESGLAAQRLEVEITESVLLDNTLTNIGILQKLRALGVRIALDDFGTGYSSLSYLRSFPFDKIKIDRSFINDMKESREALAIIRAITGMSRSLDIQITAEGVENSEQFESLKQEGCTQFQGYYFGLPQPAETRLKKF